MLMALHLPLAAYSFDWSYFNRFIFNSLVTKGVFLTLVIAVLSQLTGALIGLVLYLMRNSRIVGLSQIANVYIWFFRGTPLLIQLFVIYTSIQYFPNFVKFLYINDPFVNYGFFNGDPNITYLLPAFLASYISFSLNEGAYMAEIVRAGIDSIDVGQMEAARSLGMRYGLAMRRIILPQAARVIVPPLGNEFNSMLKTTSLAYGIGMRELFGSVYDFAIPTGHPLELFLVASVWYLLLTTIWGLIQAYIERRFNAANNRSAPPPFWQRLLGSAPREKPTEILSAEAIISGRR